MSDDDEVIRFEFIDQDLEDKMTTSYKRKSKNQATYGILIVREMLSLKLSCCCLTWGFSHGKGWRRICRDELGLKKEAWNTQERIAT